MEENLAIEYDERYEPSKTKACLEIIEAKRADLFRRQVTSYVLIHHDATGLMVVVISEWDWCMFWNLVICLEADARDRSLVAK